MKLFIALFLYTCLPLAAFGANDSMRLSKELDAAPAWDEMTNKNITSDGPKLLVIINKLSNMKPEELRVFIKDFITRTPADWRALNSSYPLSAKLSALSKIYVLNRYYFNVPKLENDSVCLRFGGWLIPDSGSPGFCNALYPLTKDDNENWHIQRGRLAYSGPPYNALGEFDYFSKKYGVRQK